MQKLLQRLEQKAMSRETRRQYASQQLESLANKLTDGSLAPFITHLMEARKISAKGTRRNP